MGWLSWLSVGLLVRKGGGWWVVCGEWQVEGGGWWVACGGWQVVVDGCTHSWAQLTNNVASANR